MSGLGLSSRKKTTEGDIIVVYKIMKGWRGTDLSLSVSA